MVTNRVFSRMRSSIMTPSQAFFFIFLAVFSLLSSKSLSKEDDSAEAGYGDRFNSAVSAAAGYGYRFISSQADVSGNLLTAELQLIRNSSLYGPDIQKLYFAASFENKHQLRIRLTDADNPRWEIPSTIIPRQNPSSSSSQKRQQQSGSAASRGHAVLSPPDSDLTLAITTSSPFSFTVTRRSTSQILFKSSNLIFKHRFLQIASSLPRDNANLYGLGEHTRKSFKLVPGDKLTLWNADTASMIPNVNLYGSHPFYMDVRSPGGKAHGVLLMNSNGMDVIYGGDYITYKVIGGVLDFYVFAGPSPVEVLDQYTELIGRPAPMPYWSFGFHQCRYGYKNYTELEQVVAGYATAGIPLSVMWTDIDYMDSYKDFTLDPINFPADKMRQFVDRLHSDGQKYVVILDPGISTNTTYPTYQRGLEAQIFIKWNGTNYLGQVWPGPVYFPDFLNPAASQFWSNEISIFRKTLPVDGLWIDMNEISNFITSPPLTDLDRPPYVIDNGGVRRPIVNNTVPASAVHYGDLTEYDVHNLYGLLQSKATHEALVKDTGKRPFVLSRSTFVGSGKYTAHWTGDNAATWEDLAYSIPSILNSGLFGMPMIGADICGFNGNTTEELCRRWIQLGAFYPFSRDHSVKNSIGQELYLWKSVAESAKKALGLRYRLLPYYYTQMYHAHKSGTPIARPLFFSFPEDSNTYGINTQFMIGEAILVSPVLQQGATSVEAYFPKGRWFNLFDNAETVEASSGEKIMIHAPSDSINVHVRGGTVLILQNSTTASLTTRTPLEIVVVLNENGTATGEAFFDDGEVVEMGGDEKEWSLIRFTCKVEGGKVNLHAEVVNGTYWTEKLVVEKVVILGLNSASTSALPTVHINKQLISVGKVVASKASSNSRGRFGSVEITGLSQCILEKFHVQIHLAHKKKL